MAPADTRGRGDPSIAGSVQGSLAFGDNGGLLFAVDPGSNEITSFRVGTNGLTFADKVSSNGSQPVSLTVRDNLLYVVDAGSSQITGFRIDETGKLHSIPGSTQPLSGKNVGPAEISFDSSGTLLVVTEKTTGKIDTYSVANDVPSGPTVFNSSGTEPFGFAFLRAERLMVVADAFNGAPGAGAASSYIATPNHLRLISSMIPDKNTAPCWIAIVPDGRIAFTSNTKSDTISAYGISAQGQLSLEKGNGISATTGKGPADLALTPDGKFLFVINLKGRTLGAYSVAPDGKLGKLSDAPPLPDGALGLVALQIGT
jgi:6-phosphogluconolactonase (cycloisomerase 2 family)